MRSTAVLMSVVSIALMLAACRTGHVNTGAVEQRPLGREFVEAEHTVAQHEAEGGNVMDVPEEITLRDAFALALCLNPELKGFSYEVRAAEARTLQAGLLPNPELGVEVEEFDRAGEGSASSEMVIGLGQLIELGGKRKWRRQVAEIEGELAAWNYE